MKITQSILVASLSVAAHSSVASQVRDFSPQRLLSPRAGKVSLGRARAPRINTRRLGRRAPSLPVALEPQAELPDNDIIQSESPVANVMDLSSGAAGGLRTDNGPLSGPVGVAVSKALRTTADTLQGAPAVGDLTKVLPLDSLGQGEPLSSLIDVASNTVSGLPAVGGPLANGLNSTATLTQALPLSLTIMPASRAMVSTNNPFHQLPVGAHQLTMAGGAFPIQPSRSLDGLTLPNEPTGFGPLHPQYTRLVNSLDDPQEKSVKTQQEPEESQQQSEETQQESEEAQVQSARHPEEDDQVPESGNDSQIDSQAQQKSEEDSQVQSARYPAEDDEVSGTENDGQFHSQELPEEEDQSKPSSNFPNALPVNSHVQTSGFVPDFLASDFDHSPSPLLELSLPKANSSVNKNMENQSPLQSQKLSSQHLKRWWKAKAFTISQKISRQR